MTLEELSRVNKQELRSIYFDTFGCHPPLSANREDLISAILNKHKLFNPVDMIRSHQMKALAENWYRVATYLPCHGICGEHDDYQVFECQAVNGQLNEKGIYFQHPIFSEKGEKNCPSTK